MLVLGYTLFFELHIVECIYITKVLVKLHYKAFNFLVNDNQEFEEETRIYQTIFFVLKNGNTLFVI